MNNVAVEFPGIRLSIIGEVKNLSDKRLHLKEWTKGQGNLLGQY
jgi:hypothetical protein